MVQCLDYRLENVGFESRLKKMIFLFPKQQRLTFGPTHTPMQCVQEAHSFVRLTTHPHLVPRLRMNVALPLPLPPMCLHGK